MWHLDAAISKEIHAATRGLPLYQGGPGVDYTDAADAYAVNVTVVRVRFPVSDLSPGEPLALLVKRAAGYGTWSDVSGFVDTMFIPTPGGSRKRGDFDPVAYAIRMELEGKCGFGPKVQADMTFRLGERFQVRSQNGGSLHVLPVLAVYRGMLPPTVRLNPAELSDYQWVRLSQITAIPDLSPGYRDNTLPRIITVLRATQP